MFLRSLMTIFATLGLIDSAVAVSEEPKSLQTVPLNALSGDQLADLLQNLPADLAEEILNQGFLIYDSANGVIRANAVEIEIEDGVRYKFIEATPCT